MRAGAATGTMAYSRITVWREVSVQRGRTQPVSLFFDVKLLINEPPLQVLPTLAKLIGLNAAIALQQVHYRLSGWGELDDAGRPWINCTVAEWQAKDFTFWSERT